MLVLWDFPLRPIETRRLVQRTKFDSVWRCLFMNEFRSFKAWSKGLWLLARPCMIRFCIQASTLIQHNPELLSYWEAACLRWNVCTRFQGKQDTKHLALLLQIHFGAISPPPLSPFTKILYVRPDVTPPSPTHQKLKNFKIYLEKQLGFFWRR